VAAVPVEDPLDLLLDDGVIDEVLGRLKSGKEANIFLVRRAGQVVAAKVYKDRDQRSFKSNADYKEGRKNRNSRTQRAIERGGRFGREAAEQAWKATESDTLRMLHARGIRVPQPVIFYEGVLLMELVNGDDGRPAPRLIDVALDPSAVRSIYLDLRSMLVGMLCCEIIHGDLSPYNILAAAAGPTIIDFPQVVSAAHNSRAEFFFQRDFQNVLQYFVGADRTLTSHGHDGAAIWKAYTQRDLTVDFVPPPPPPPSRHGRDHRRGRPPRGLAPPPEIRRAEARPPRAFGPPRASAAPPAPARAVRRRPKRRW
jgi:RIO kinase 1